MRLSQIGTFAMIAGSIVALGAPASFAKAGLNAGVLQCTIEPAMGYIIASSREMDCTFNPGRGRDQHYTGTMTKLGLDIGMTGEGSFAWLVIAPGSVDRGSLEGRYAGVSAQATVAAGLGANVLIGGLEHSIALQPISVQGQTGLNVAVGIAGLHLRFEN